MTTPSLGRVVHITASHAADKIVRAAIISHVEKKPELDTTKEKYDSEENAYWVDLHVLTPYGIEVEKNVAYHSDLGEPGPRRWFWPPRV